MPGLRAGQAADGAAREDFGARKWHAPAGHQKHASTGRCRAVNLCTLSWHLAVSYAVGRHDVCLTG